MQRGLSSFSEIAYVAQMALTLVTLQQLYCLYQTFGLLVGYYCIIYLEHVELIISCLFYTDCCPGQVPLIYVNREGNICFNIHLLIIYF